MAEDRPSLEQITKRLLGSVPADVADDLRAEDPTTAIELHFPPVETQALAGRDITNGDCSVDGFYDSQIDPDRPWILYADDVAPPRVRFTLLHELGHHLLVTTAAELLDDLDRLGGSPAEATRAEEAVCHRLAGELLMPQSLITEVIGDERVGPAQLKAVKEVTGASWEAVAVRLTQLASEPMAVVLMRTPGHISFAAASPRLGWAWWPRGAGTDPNGPLAGALTGARTARPDTYRYGLPYARRLFCDAEPVAASLAIGVLTERPSDGHFEILEEPEPIWRETWEYCLWCNGDRDTGWCDQCKGQRCRDCGRCGCGKPVVNPVCKQCGLRQPHRTGSAKCRDCEADSA